VKILVIRLARFGDVVLLLPALTQLKASVPDAHLSLLTGHRCSPLAEMCPAIDEVLSVDRISMRDGPPWRALAGIGGLISDIRRRNFDLVMDCHSLRETNLLAWVSGAKQRIGLKRFDQSHLGFCFNAPPVMEDKSIHVSEMFMKIVHRFGSGSTPAMPSIVVPDEAKQWASRALPSRPLVALYIDAPVPERIWPAERFAVVGDHIVNHWDAEVTVLAGPGRKSAAEQCRARMRFAAKCHDLSDLRIPQLAAAVEASSFFVSNDTGPMHLGPALGVQTLGLFSVGVPEHFRPTGPLDGVLRGTPIECIQTEDVIGKMEEMRRGGAVPTARPDPLY